MESSDRDVRRGAFDLREHLLAGQVIPAHPLALTASRYVDERSQRALTRYYVASGAGGIAVGVHTTGFAIHQGSVGLYEPVLALAAESASEALCLQPRNFIKVAGVVGNTLQALQEADIANRLGYDCGLLSLGAWRNAGDDEILQHCREVASAIPLFGFYLQPAVGGRLLSYSFWREFMDIPNVVAIKVAPFNRYQTLDVARALLDAGRRDVALYTGNDDCIIADLLTDVSAGNGIQAPGSNDETTVSRSCHFAGGLLGQWVVWTSVAAKLLQDIKAWRSGSTSIPPQWLTMGANLTMTNAAVFDSANGFAGCIPGILHVLQGQGLVHTELTLDDSEVMSPGQRELILEMRRRYPELTDDAFVAAHLEEWRKN